MYTAEHYKPNKRGMSAREGIEIIIREYQVNLSKQTFQKYLQQGLIVLPQMGKGPQMMNLTNESFKLLVDALKTYL